MNSLATILQSEKRYAETEKNSEEPSQTCNEACRGRNIPQRKGPVAHPPRPGYRQGLQRKRSSPTRSIRNLQLALSMAVETFSQDVTGRLPSTPLSCGFTLGFIRSPKNKIARFQRCSRQNLAQFLFLKNQVYSLSIIHWLHFLTGDDAGYCWAVLGAERMDGTRIVAQIRSPQRWGRDFGAAGWSGFVVSDFFFSSAFFGSALFLFSSWITISTAFRVGQKAVYFGAPVTVPGAAPPVNLYPVHHQVASSRKGVFTDPVKDGNNNNDHCPSIRFQVSLVV